MRDFTQENPLVQSAVNLGIDGQIVVRHWGEQPDFIRFQGGLESRRVGLHCGYPTSKINGS